MKIIIIFQILDDVEQRDGKSSLKVFFEFKGTSNSALVLALRPAILWLPGPKVAHSTL